MCNEPSGQKAATYNARSPRGSGGGMPGVGPVATVAGLTLLQPSPYLCQLCFMFIRVFVGLELRPSVLVAPGAFLLHE